jgi:hypothetical protein
MSLIGYGVVMRFRNGTGTRVILIGVLDSCGILQMDDLGDFYMQLTLFIHDHVQNNVMSKYSVVVEGESALRVRRYGFHGLRLWIEGVLKKESGIQKIIADKVIFLDQEDPDIFSVSTNDHRIESLQYHTKIVEIVFH